MIKQEKIVKIYSRHKNPPPQHLSNFVHLGGILYAIFSISISTTLHFWPNFCQLTRVRLKFGCVEMVGHPNPPNTWALQTESTAPNTNNSSFIVVYYGKTRTIAILAPLSAVSPVYIEVLEKIFTCQGGMAVVLIQCLCKWFCCWTSVRDIFLNSCVAMKLQMTRVNFCDIRGKPRVFQRVRIWSTLAEVC